MAASLCEPLYTLYQRSSADSLEHAIDHHSGKPEVIRRVAKLAELLAVDVLGDCGVLAQKIQQGPLLPDRLAAQVIDQVVGVLAAEVGGETHHDRLRDHQALRRIEVGPHALRVDL